MKKLLNFSLLILVQVLLFASCKTKKESSEILLTNNSEFELTDKAVSIDRNLLAKEEVSKAFPILISGTDTIPSQINDTNGDGNWDELFLVTNFSAKETKTIQLEWVSTNPNYVARTSVRFGKRASKDAPVLPATEEVLQSKEVYKALGYQRYQTDGPTWENDKVGFRHYLDGRNAKDVFGKKTPEITPENVGIDSLGAVADNYHEMHDWGRDVFPVGNSAGLGGFALLVNEEINRLGITTNDTLNNIEKTTFKIVEEGPVNSILSYNYHNWKASNNTYQAKEITSIWPGMYGYKNTVSVDGLKDNDALLIALSNINNKNSLNEVEVGNWICLIQHGALTYNEEWVLGTAVIVPKKGYNGYIEAPKSGQLTTSYLAKFKIKNNESINYYAIAGWELSADKNFKDPTYFKNYVINLANQLEAEINIKINE